MAATPRIFISYRRGDTSGYAGRLDDRLTAHFGRDQIFRDVDTIKPGVDFTEVIRQAVASCHALIAVIGKDWLTATDEQGERRLDNPQDFVRLEVSAALERHVLVIPALVSGSRMPRPTELPEDLVPLANRNALTLSDERWDYDVGLLIRTLQEDLETSPPTKARPPMKVEAPGGAAVEDEASAPAAERRKTIRRPRKRPGLRRVPRWLVVVLALAVAGGLATAGIVAISSPSPKPTSGQSSGTTPTSIPTVVDNLGDRTLFLRTPHFTGTDVRDLQVRLTELGFPPGAIDANFRPSTADAVKTFKTCVGLPIDGKVDRETVQKLDVAFSRGLKGGPGDDRLEGTEGNDMIFGLGGNDTIDGLGGNDIICGGEGDDVLNGGSGNDRILGGPGNDTLNGGDGDDILRGGEGNDEIDSGTGHDTVIGGGGTDACNVQSGTSTLCEPSPSPSG